MTAYTVTPLASFSLKLGLSLNSRTGLTALLLSPSPLGGASKRQKWSETERQKELICLIGSLDKTDTARPLNIAVYGKPL